MESKNFKRINVVELWLIVVALGVLWSTTSAWPSPSTRQLSIGLRLAAFAGTVANVYFVLLWICRRVPITTAWITSGCLALCWTVMGALHITFLNLMGNPLWLGVSASVGSCLVIRQRTSFSWKDSCATAITGACCILVTWVIVFTLRTNQLNS